LAFKTLLLMLLEGKLCVTKQEKALKDTFILIHLIFQSDLSQKISHLNLTNVTEGGGVIRKELKKCHVLFEWPLTAVNRTLKLAG
jgi:hypothetical protein